MAYGELTLNKISETLQSYYQPSYSYYVEPTWLRILNEMREGRESTMGTHEQTQGGNDVAEAIRTLKELHEKVGVYAIRELISIIEINNNDIRRKRSSEIRQWLRNNKLVRGAVNVGHVEFREITRYVTQSDGEYRRVPTKRLIINIATRRVIDLIVDQDKWGEYIQTGNMPEVERVQF